MIDHLYAKTKKFNDRYMPGCREFRAEHPARAQLVDAAMLANWTCWLVALIGLAWELLS